MKFFTLLLLFFISIFVTAQRIETVHISDWNKLQSSGFFAVMGNQGANCPLDNDRWWWGMNTTYHNNNGSRFYNAQIAFEYASQPIQMYIRITNENGSGSWVKVLHNQGKQEINGGLDVAGTIRSKEVKIEATGWSDYVFGKNYSLPKLTDVENHIQKYGHLPNIPSEKEVLENGVNVVEMQAKLLEKIEELTLYVIEQDKEIKEQRVLIEALQAQLKE